MTLLTRSELNEKYLPIENVAVSMSLYLITAPKAIFSDTLFSFVPSFYCNTVLSVLYDIAFDRFILNITVLDTSRVSSSSGSGKCNRRRIDGESRPSLKSAALLRG